MELWSLLSITAPGLFPSPQRFTRVLRAGRSRRQGDAERLAQLRRRIRPLMLRRTKEQVAADLPAKQEQVLEVELHPRHRKLYQTHLQRERQKVLGLIDDLDAQPVHDLPLADPAAPAQPGRRRWSTTTYAGRAVAASSTRWSSSCATWSPRATGRWSSASSPASSARSATGSTPTGIALLLPRRHAPATGPRCIARFKDGAAPVFLISLKAGGFGLNLTEADYCFLLDPWWNPATEAQAVDRTHRIGQTRNVMVYRLVAKDTIEEKVMALKARKAELFASVIDDGDAVRRPPRRRRHPRAARLALRQGRGRL